ncbi:hypothetical protein PIB30_085643, partial [Stylosanthes scabra]|nr:hypothetical protein [Stylosanthes scabra]
MTHTPLYTNSTTPCPSLVHYTFHAHTHTFIHSHHTYTQQPPTLHLQSITISTLKLRLPFRRRLREALSIVFKSIPIVE